MKMHNVHGCRTQGLAQRSHATPDATSFFDGTGHRQLGLDGGIPSLPARIGKPYCCAQAGIVLGVRQIDYQLLPSSKRRGRNYVEDTSWLNYSSTQQVCRLLATAAAVTMKFPD